MTGMAAAVAWGLWLAWGGCEEYRARRRLAGIRHRILCGGIRGKSSLVRLVHAGLVAGGFRALGRVTGGEPALLLPDGSETPHPRRGPPNIRELRALLLSQRAAQADAVVIENMAIEPELQEVVARRFVRPTVQLLACDAVDHLESLPAEPAGRAALLLGALDSRVPLAVADYEANRATREQAAAMGFRLLACAAGDCRADSARPGEPPLRAHMAPLAACALAAIREIGCLDAGAREAVLRHAARLQQIAVYRVGESAWVDLLSANDPESARQLIAGVLTLDKSRYFARTVLLFNHRGDRPLRLNAFAPLLREFESVIVGDRVARGRAARAGSTWTAEAPPELAKGPNLVFLTGNAGGHGRALCAGLAAAGTVERW